MHRACKISLSGSGLISDRTIGLLKVLSFICISLPLVQVKTFAYYSYPLLAPLLLFYDVEFQNIAHFTIRAQLRKLELNENLSKSSNTITM